MSSSPTVSPTSSTPAPKSERGHDFAAGVVLDALAEGVAVAGFVGEADVVAVRRGTTVHLVGAKCSHYGAPLLQGRVEGERIVCPWHHAAFSLHDGATLKAPGLSPIACWSVRRQDGKVFAERRLPLARRIAVTRRPPPGRVAIVGAGAAAFSAVAELRQQGFGGAIDVFGAEPEAPYDRPKLSKAYLAKAVGDDKLPLDGTFLSTQHVDGGQPVRWHLGHAVKKLDLQARTLQLTDGDTHPYDACILATGARPALPGITGEKRAQVHVLRSAADARRLVRATEQVGHVLIVGASFIGLEAACALRKREVTVHVVGGGGAPLAKVLGPEIGERLRLLHQQQGVTFHPDARVVNIGARTATLTDGTELAADLVLLATGVTPATDVAQSAKLACDDGVLVDAQLRTADANVWAAGDVARWPWPKDGKPVRIEHWAVAEQMGRVAARNVLGSGEAFNEVPFFWTEHYAMKLRYVGHTRELVRHESFGDLPAGRAAVALYDAQGLGAVATVGCDQVSLACEAAMAAGRGDEAVRQILRAL